jgi:ribose/xylose/arabinose/galactoside ABC-type transport system permease subunit
VLAHGQLVDVRDPTFLFLGSGDVLGVPVAVLAAAVLAVGTGLLVSRKAFGRRLVAIGDNRAASGLAGLPVRRVLVAVYAISGALIVTLATLLFARGLLPALTSEGSTTYTISDPFVLGLGRAAFLGLGVPVWIALVLCGIGGVVLQRTRFGETVFATGGAESSALLMGLPVARTRA